MESQERNKENNDHPKSHLPKFGMAFALAVLLIAVTVRAGWLPNLSHLLGKSDSDTLIEQIIPHAPGVADVPHPPRLEDLPPLPPPRFLAIPESPDTDVFVIVDQMPEMIGGLGQLQKNIQYPSIALKAGVQGRVFVSFIVDTEGRVTDPVVVRGIGAGCDEEAVRALLESSFRPGRQRGTPVRVKMSIPITFRLSE